MPEIGGLHHRYEGRAARKARIDTKTRLHGVSDLFLNYSELRQVTYGGISAGLLIRPLATRPKQAGSEQ